MKLRDGYVLREVAGNHVVVPTGKAALDFSGMITLNGTAAFLWHQLSREKTEQELLSSLLRNMKSARQPQERIFLNSLPS